MYAAELRPRAEPGYVHSLGCDPVKFSQDLGRANRTLALTQNRRLLVSKPTSDSDKRSQTVNTNYEQWNSNCLWDLNSRMRESVLKLSLLFNPF